MTLKTLAMYQNAIRYKEKENAFIKTFVNLVLFSLVFVIKLRGSMNYKHIKANLNL